MHIAAPRLRRLPRAGEPLDRSFPQVPFVVEAGSRVVAQVVGDSGRGQSFSLLTATDVEAAVRRYRKVASDARYVESTHDDGHRTEAGWGIDGWSAGGSEGPTVNISVLRRDGKAYIAISVAPYA